MPDNWGWVEYREHERGPWQAVVSLWPLTEPPYCGIWSCLFSDGETIGFRPIALKRGLPTDASARTRRDYEGNKPRPGQDLGVTWVGWDEIRGQNWDELSPWYDDVGPRRYKRGLAGEWVFDAYANDKESFPSKDSDARLEWEKDGYLYRFERQTRWEVFHASRDWEIVFDMVRVLADEYGDRNVRIVIWFV